MRERVVGDMNRFDGVVELFAVADVSGGSIRVMHALEGGVFLKRFGADWIRVYALCRRDTRSHQELFL